MRSDTRRIGRFTARKRRSAGNKLIGANWRTNRADAVFQRFMAEKKKFQAIKGTRDLLPPETELWNRVEQTAREVFGTFGFGEIRPPIFEPTELFARAVGGETDIVSKEMYAFVDRHEKIRAPMRFDQYDGFMANVKKLLDSGEIPTTLRNTTALAEMEERWNRRMNVQLPRDEAIENAYYITV